MIFDGILDIESSNAISLEDTAIPFNSHLRKNSPKVLMITEIAVTVEIAIYTLSLSLFFFLIKNVNTITKLKIRKNIPKNIGTNTDNSNIFSFPNKEISKPFEV